MSLFLFLLLPAAMAAPLDRFPIMATVSLESCDGCTPQAAQEGSGAFRLSVPVELRTPWEPGDGTDLLLLGPDGEPLSVAVVTGGAEPELEPLTLYPRSEPDLFHVERQPRLLDGVRVILPGGPAAASVEVLEQSGGRWIENAGPTVIWQNDDLGESDLRLRPTAGPLLLRIQYHRRGGGGLPRLEGYRLLGPRVEPVELDLPVTTWRLGEDGWARYMVSLPQPLPVERLRLQVEDELFDREVTVTGPDALAAWSPPAATGRIQRILLGGASVDHMVVQVPEGVWSDELVVWIRAEGRKPLQVTGVTAIMEGEELLLLEPGPGPFTLLGGAPAGTGGSWDLQIALPELDRLARARLEAEEVLPNPDYSPPEERANLTSPSVPADLARQRWYHEVDGPAGVPARLTLTPEVLAEARPDRADIRLVDVEGRLIPHVMRRSAVDLVTPDLPFSREEAGSTSRLRIPLPEPGAPVATVTLETTAPVFSRSVTILRSRGGEAEPLRHFQWRGEDRPSHLALEVNAVVGEEMVVMVDNTANPPLPISSVSVTRPTWEIQAVLPEGGARLYYGDHAASSPGYDLALLEVELSQRVVASAEMGPRQAATPPPRSLLERVTLLVGILALVAGLAALTVRLVRAAPPDERS